MPFMHCKLFIADLFKFIIGILLLTYELLSLIVSAHVMDLSPSPSVGLFVSLSVRKVYCGKTTEWIGMPFGMVSGVGWGMGVLDEAGYHRRRRCSFEAEMGTLFHSCTQGSYRPWKVLESPGIKILSFPGVESPGKRHRSWKTLEKSWNSKVLVLEILISGTSIANFRRNLL